jgi:shikimate kinase
VGLRGAGKSTVGRALAVALRRPFVDLDRAVEGRAGESVQALFAGRGEAAFRALEAEALRETLRLVPGVVVATGGGVVLAPKNRAVLASARVAYLTAPLEVLAARVRADPASEATRPSLAPGGPLAEARALYEVRDPLYREVADVVVDADQPVAAVVAALRAALGAV